MIQRGYLAVTLCVLLLPCAVVAQYSQANNTTVAPPPPVATAPLPSGVPATTTLFRAVFDPSRSNPSWTTSSGLSLSVAQAVSTTSANIVVYGFNSVAGTAYFYTPVAAVALRITTTNPAYFGLVRLSWSGDLNGQADAWATSPPPDPPSSWDKARPIVSTVLCLIGVGTFAAWYLYRRRQQQQLANSMMMQSQQQQMLTMPHQQQHYAGSSYVGVPVAAHAQGGNGGYYAAPPPNPFAHQQPPMHPYGTAQYTTAPHQPTGSIEPVGSNVVACSA